MVEKERKLYVAIDKDGIHKIEGFIEEICDDFNIFNSYFGNILMAVVEACENSFILIDKTESNELLINFWSEKNKLVFNIQGKKEAYVKKIDFDKLDIEGNAINDDTKSGLIIKMLSDEVEIDDKNNAVRLTFYISSINYDTSLRREKSIKEYFEKIKKSIKTHE